MLPFRPCNNPMRMDARYESFMYIYEVVNIIDG
jgi:hypothetical protein